MLKLSYHTKYTQEEAITMDYPNNNTKHEKGKHLKYEDYRAQYETNRQNSGRKIDALNKQKFLLYVEKQAGQWVPVQGKP